MYEIAICEDEAIFSETLEAMCRELLDEAGAQYRIRIFPGAGPFLEAFSGGRFHLYLLDVVMEGMNGMELARAIRAAYPRGTIIFTTSSPEFAVQGYDVEARDYLLKPVEREKLKARLLEDFNTNYLHTHIILKDGAMQKRVAVGEIIYLETVDRRVRVVTAQGELSYAGKLAQQLGQLPPDRFVRCHQGFAVNLEHMDLSGRYQVHTPAGTLPVSRRFVEDTRRAFFHSIELFPWKTGGGAGC